uniref:Putative terpene synthase 8 n=1 Tax=Eremophila drummondii TaxID=2652523 RepID=A0A6G9KSR6_9LAMI|nr:putative terpene synthase 8 [Eremophila drummondii]
MAAMTIHTVYPSKPLVNGNLCSFKHRKASKAFPHHVYPNYGAAANTTRHIICSSSSSSLRSSNEPKVDHLQAAAPVAILPRRSGNYKPSLWDFEFIQSLNSKYKDEGYLRRASELQVQVEKLMEEAMLSKPVIEQLELIDYLQRLALSDHFEHQIKKILSCIYEEEYKKKNHEPRGRDMYATALAFRLLRQHGFSVSQDIFDCFKNKDDGGFKASLTDDTRGLLQLYESSFQSVEGEMTMDQAREFATFHLERKLDHGLISDDDDLLVRRSLELPFHWGVPWIEARWFIGVYARRRDVMNPTVLELAKLDFNIRQAIHQEELKSVSRWSKNIRLAEKLPFVRDRVVESFIYASGFVEPRDCGNARIANAIFSYLLITIDDIFDVYGTLEELQLYTHAIDRWDIQWINHLPDYMQISYLALYNFINEVACGYLIDQGSIIIPRMKKSLADFTNSYLQEANWYHSGHTPSVDEYLENGWLSAGGPTMSYLTFFALKNPFKKEAIQGLDDYHNILRLPSMVTRLVNDIGTFSVEMEKGDAATAIQCSMNETGASKEEASEHIRSLIREAWKKLNAEALDAESIFSRAFIKSCVNYCRIAHFLYRNGSDGLGIDHKSVLVDDINGLLFEPIE